MIRPSLPKRPVSPAAISSIMCPASCLLIAVGLLGKYAQIGWKSLAHHEHWTVPDIEYVLWAIVIGLLVTNTVGLHRIFRAGVQTYEFWLKIGIVALGVRFVLGDVVKLGGISLVQILVDMTVAGAIILAAAHFFGLSGKLGSLLAIGTSICGVSAIVAAKGRYPGAQFRRRLRDRGDLGTGGRRTVHTAAARTRDRPQRPRIRLVGRSGGGQHRRDHRDGLPVLRTGGQGRGAGEVHPQRSDRFRGTGFRACTGRHAARQIRSHRACGHGPHSFGTSSPSSSWVFWRCRRSRPPAG